MSSKSDYTPEEWQLLLDVPPLVGTAVMVAGKSGLGSMKEAFALASGVIGAKSGYEGNELITALIEGRMKDGDRSEVEQLSTNPYRGQPPEEIAAAAVEKCKQVATLLDTKSTPTESDQFKSWSIAVGEKVANAAKEGGFLGIGGERVSESEKEVLTAVAAALGV
jgi:hypothetical protein